ncbi:Uncharacterized protein PCOAH_00000350 [Plasmodium coatneyi]|uniref:Uncharacterized protein n=1 Tax=Plasmodium coatneyi TaxID=208452 RepID=A0A1B1DT09_9APIC|nr:Uncharacterized protein PCOAH_00000350 [Plasmodium coatneyi]ANQ05882.1 Uncharacterized protein PCOAH_00000350 [Plasmodium coatneyi]
MAHSIGSPYTLYSVVDVDKPFTSFSDNYYVSEPYNPPYTPVISSMFHGSFPCYYVDDDGYYYIEEEDFLMKKPKIVEDPKPDENKTEEVENKAENVDSTNKKMTLFQAVMIVVLFMRWGRRNSTRLIKKHEARKQLLLYLDLMNTKIKKDDLKMEKKKKKMEAKIKKEEEDMEVKWKDKRAAIRQKIAKNPSKDILPGIGPFYDHDKILLDKKLDIIDMNYEKCKFNKKKRWKAMRESYRKELNKLQKKQDERKMKKCVRMFWFEEKWNFGPTTVRGFLKQKRRKCDLQEMYCTTNEKLKERKEGKDETEGAEEVGGSEKEEEEELDVDKDSYDDKDDDDDDDESADDSLTEEESEVDETENDDDEEEEEEEAEEEEVDDDSDEEDDDEDEEDDEGDTEEEDKQDDTDEDDDGYYENYDYY